MDFHLYSDSSKLDSYINIRNFSSEIHFFAHIHVDFAGAVVQSQFLRASQHFDKLLLAVSNMNRVVKIYTLVTSVLT